MTATFNTFDIIFFVFTFIFVVSAFFRGFIKEIFSLFNWIFSLLLSYFLAPFASDILAEYFSNRLLLEGITRSTIFIISFITIALTTSNLRDDVQSKIPSLFDKSLGVFFGFIKTLIIFGCIYSIYGNLNSLGFGKSDKKDPQWLVEAKSYSLIKFSGETFNPLISKFFESISGNLKDLIPQDNLDEKIDEVIEEKPLETKDPEPTKTKDLEDVKKNSGYSKKDIEKMNHLIDIIDK